VVLVPLDEPDVDEPESEPDFFEVEPLLSLLDDELLLSDPLLLDEPLEELSDPLLDDESPDPLDELSDDDPDFSLVLSPGLSPEPLDAVVDDPLLLSVL